MKYGVLVGHEVWEANSIMEAARGLEGDRRVAFDKVGGAEISTVFLGVNHRYDDGPPLWFETMVFGGDDDGEIDRYSTWEEAERGHKAIVSRLRAADKAKKMTK